MSFGPIDQHGKTHEAGGRDPITGFQPADADLDIWATLTPSANAQSLVTAADYAAMRAVLDLEAGTDFPSLSTFNDHSARHENGGGDEISVADLSGVLADPQTPIAASQTEQEAASITTKAVTPGTQHNHPSAAKVWAYITWSLGVPSVAAHLNIASVDDDGAGNFEVFWSTDFASGSYAVFANAINNNDGVLLTVPSERGAADMEADACGFYVSDGTTTVDPVAATVLAFGDQ